MKLRRIYKVLLHLAVLILIFAANPGCAQKNATQVAVEKALERAFEKATDNVINEINKPEFWERINSVALKMPAVKEKPVLWHTGLTQYSVKDMRFIAPDRLLVTQSSSTPVLVDSSTGEVLWKFKPEGWLIGYYDLVAAFTDLIMIREDDAKEGLTTLAAIDAKTGKQLWFIAFKNKKHSFQFLPIPASGAVVVVGLAKKRVTLTTLDLLSGKQLWQKQLRVGKRGHSSPPVTTSGQIWHFYGVTAMVDPATGRNLWERKDAVLENKSPPPVLYDKNLYLIDEKKVLHVLIPDTGEDTMTIPLDSKVRYTNIYPTKNRVYLRGENIGGAMVLSVCDAKTGKSFWTRTSSKPTVSNIIEDGSRLYVATPSHLLCLDRDTGKEHFKSLATLTGQSFPVRIRKFKDKVVYIGELMIAGFDAKTGAKVYNAGMTPVSQEAHLDALDNWISVLQNRIGKLGKAIWFGGAGGASDVFSRQAEISQNLSNQYSRQAASYRLQSNYRYNMSASSDYWKSANLQNQAQIESAYAGAAAQIGFFFAMEDLKNTMLASAIAADKRELSRLERIRKKILSAYTAAESAEHAYRSHVEKDWIGVNLVHLPTGKATFTPFSPLIKKNDCAYYNERTLWNLVDVDKGIVYHHALRILPKRFQQENKPGEVTYGIQLVAEKIAISK